LNKPIQDLKGETLPSYGAEKQQLVLETGILNHTKTPNHSHCYKRERYFENYQGIRTIILRKCDFGKNYLSNDQLLLYGVKELYRMRERHFGLPNSFC